jgi:hypothetical protein
MVFDAVTEKAWPPGSSGGAKVEQLPPDGSGTIAACAFGAPTADLAVQRYLIS